MTETEQDPPAPQSIQARIAALRLEQIRTAPNTPAPSYDAARKAKPPPPPLPKRAASASPATTNGGVGNTPAGLRAKPPPPPAPERRDVLPAPVMKKWEGRDKVESPQLPPRRPSEQGQAPALPSRRGSEQNVTLGRRPSTESVSSIASGRSSISGLSLKATNSNGERQYGRVRAPEYDPATLPPLPGKKVKQEEPPRVPLRSTVSAPSVQKANGGPPPLPGRPALPARNGTMSSQPAQPSRPKKSILEMGFNNKVVEAQPPPLPGSRPSPAQSTYTNGQHVPVAAGNAAEEEALVELTAATFDDVVLRSGRPSFVDFYAPFCKYCKELDPTYKQLADMYRYSPITIAKIDSYTEKEIGDRYQIEGWPTLMIFDGKGGEPVKYPWGYDLEWLQKFIKQETGIKPGAPPPVNSSAPPPVPTASRPNLAELNKTKPSAATATAPATDQCLKCRDFSGPDNHATRFPRQSIPSQDPKWLGSQLCSPFPSLTDKARAIFTWLHHNINYDVDAFFANNVQPSTPNSTMSTGLAVCEGYAALFTSLATAAGLESVVIGGHGKGFGFDALRPGQPLPRKNPTGHAWNAVKIDGGQWKLIDPCWGAGNVKGAGQPYNKDFTPEWFTMSNDEFGKRHYPENDRFFYRDDGRPSITWEEYIMFSVGPEERTVFTPARSEHGFDEKSFLPLARDIPRSAPSPTVRLQWTKICPHYDLERHHGRGYVFFVKLANDELVVAKSDGYNWWIDVPRAQLPASGQECSIQFMQKFMGRDGEWRDGRTLDERGVREGMGGRAGWRSWSWSFLARWNVV